MKISELIDLLAKLPEDATVRSCSHSAESVCDIIDFGYDEGRVINRRVTLVIELPDRPWRTEHRGLVDIDTDEPSDAMMARIVSEVDQGRLADEAIGEVDTLEIPEWANWVAQDEDGSWFAYEDRPWFIGTEDLEWLVSSGKNKPIGLGKSPGGEWVRRLYQVMWVPIQGAPQGYVTQVIEVLSSPANEVDTLAVPGWANWLAQDADGAWFAYEIAPVCGTRSWMLGLDVSVDCKYTVVQSGKAPNPDWRSQLYSISADGRRLKVE